MGMASKTFQDIARKYSQTLNLDETASPEIWAAKLKEELAAQQSNLQEINPQNFLYFAVERQCLDLEEALQVLNQEVRNASQPRHVVKIRQLQDELVEKQKTLQETSPQNLLYFVLQKQCLDLEAKLQVVNQEGRRSAQARLLENLRQAIHYGDKDVYDSMIKGENQPLLPTEAEAAYESWLEIKNQAANKKWPVRNAPPPPSSPIITEQRRRPPPPPAQPPRSIGLPPSDVASKPIISQGAKPPPEAPLEIPKPMPGATEQPQSKPPPANYWVWVLPAVVVIIVVLNLFSRHSGQAAQVVVNPPSPPTESAKSPTESSQTLAPPPATLAGPVTLDGLMMLFDKANKATNTEDRTDTYREFLQKGTDFAVAHPEQTNLWVKRAMSAMALDYPDAGWLAGKHLTALGLIHSEDADVLKLMVDLQQKGWLDPKRPKRDWKKYTPEQVRTAASEGDEEAQVMLGICYFSGQSDFSQDFAEAAQWYRKAAEQGDSAGQEALGAMYEYGRGVPQDYAESFQWFHKAAEQGVADAQDNLAVLYLYGSGVEKNYAKALQWFRKAADQGDPAALGNLGLMYENGWGLATNVTEAISWYRKASALGDPNAAQSLKRLTPTSQKSAL